MNINIIQIGKTKASFIRDAEHEYMKRLRPYAKINVITIKDSEKGDIKRIKEEEGRSLSAALNKLPADSIVIALDENGREFTSPQLAGYIGKKIDIGLQNITFIIGGCYGLADFVLTSAELKLSFSKLTFTHELIRPFLYEQLYRCFTLIKGKKYHY
ncbi:23S rRNA (pseudouridine(1915)-N(3))-methyltransferase RlmH [Patescibacteria group bacterium]|nr:23S rRNA (pseudouridine(1915)-N(3))-methyltransferase RlmH [Patescibacteria group bacterium]